MFSNRTFQELIIEKDTPESRLTLFCLSDKASLSLSHIITEDLDPISYSKDLLTNQFDIICKNFYPFIYQNKKITKDLKKAFIFDKLVRVCVLMRIMIIKSQGSYAIGNILGSSIPFLLTVDENLTDSLCFSGFSTLRQDILDFIHYKKAHLINRYPPILIDFAKTLTDIHDEKWFLKNKKWQHLFKADPINSYVFKNLLQAVFSSYLFEEAFFENIFEVTIKDTHIFAEEFISLINTNQNFEEIKIFLKRMRYYFDSIVSNIFFEFLYEGSFESFEYFYEKHNPLNEHVFVI